MLLHVHSLFQRWCWAQAIVSLASRQVYADVVIQDSKDYTVDNLSYKPFQSFVTRPDLHTPIVNMAWANEEDRPDASDTSLFVMTIHGNNVNPWLGALLLRPQDATPVWVCHDYEQMFNLQVQDYRGQPHLTFWHGGYDGGFGRGYGYIMDQHYEIVKKVRTANEQVLGDLHEFKLAGTSALLAYQTKAESRKDDSPYWGCFQDVDVETGDLILDWCASVHVPRRPSFESVLKALAELSTVEESYVDADKDHGKPWRELDYFHLNSVDKDEETGHYLVSGRHTHALYLISPSGEVLSRVGGKSTDFDLQGDSVFSWQHDARFVQKSGWPDLAVSLFDNAWDRAHPKQRERSRGLILGLDTKAKSATALGSYDSPVEQVSGSQGSMQVLPGSEDVVVGLGLLPHVALYKPDGTLKMHLQYGFDAESYRSTLKPWTGIPKTTPAIAIHESTGPADPPVAYVSWNGATEVDRWRIFTSSFPYYAQERPERTYTVCPRRGFESRCPIQSNLRWVSAHAFAANGTFLGASDWMHRDTMEPFEFTNAQALEEGFQVPDALATVDREGDDAALILGSNMLTQWFRAVNYLGTRLTRHRRR